MIAELDGTGESTSMLQRSLYEMELERINYMLRSYLRMRLIKISRFSLYLDTSKETRAALSQNEVRVAKRRAVHSKLMSLRGDGLWRDSLPRPPSWRDASCANSGLLHLPRRILWSDTSSYTDSM